MYTMVRPEHLNHFGNLFGGQMLKWVDEYAYLAAVRDYPGQMLVTRAMADVSFRKGVQVGSVLRFRVERGRIGVSSVAYSVTVFAQECGAREEYPVFETSIVFACIDRLYRKVPLPSPAGAAARGADASVP